MPLLNMAFFGLSKIFLLSVAIVCIFGLPSHREYPYNSHRRPHRINNEQFRRFLSNAVGQASNVSVECVACQVTVYSLNWLWSKNVTQDWVAEMVASVCKWVELEKGQVCKMISSAYKEEFLYVLGQAIINPNQICGLLLDDCGTPYNPLYSNWTIPIPENKPPVKNITVPAKPGQPALRVLHLSDIHYDPWYLEGSEADCIEPLCCRKRNATVKNPANHWATFGRCDVPARTVEAMMSHLGKHKVDYIIWTGDLIPHDVWNYSQPRTTKMLANLTLLLHHYFPGVPVYSTVGNHEGVPADSFPPNGVPERFSHTWLYDSLAKNWRTWLPSDTKSSIQYRASYATKVVKGLRIISLNTNYCYNTNFWLYINATDPDGTLAWLVEQLLDAEQAGDAVHIIGHVPPGNEDCLPSWSRNYYNIVNRFESTIRAQFFGHTHYDSFSVFFEDADVTKRATSLYYVTPSVTTFVEVVPAYRIYTIDGQRPHSSWTVLDYDQYQMDMETVHDSKHPPSWVKSYTPKAEYSMQSLLPQDWANLIKNFDRNAALFDKYLLLVVKNRVLETQHTHEHNCM